MVSIPGAGGRGAVPARGENRAPPPAPTSNNDCQIKFKLLQMDDIGAMLAFADQQNEVKKGAVGCQGAANASLTPVSISRGITSDIGYSAAL